MNNTLLFDHLIDQMDHVRNKIGGPAGNFVAGS